jgi:hypothetical protein
MHLDLVRACLINLLPFLLCYFERKNGTLREPDKGPTAVYHADDILLVRSAQFGRQAGPEKGHRHRLAIGTGAAVPTTTVGTSATLGTRLHGPSAQSDSQHKRLPGGPE